MVNTVTTVNTSNYNKQSKIDKFDWNNFESNDLTNYSINDIDDLMKKISDNNNIPENNKKDVLDKLSDKKNEIEKNNAERLKKSEEGIKQVKAEQAEQKKLDLKEVDELKKKYLNDTKTEEDTGNQRDEYQEKVNNRIRELQEEIDNYVTKREERLKAVNSEILELENKIKFAEGELENSTDPKLDHSKVMTDIEGWKKELERKNKEKEELEKELKQINLESEILELENKIKFAEGELENSTDPKLDHSKVMTDIEGWKKELANKRKELQGYGNSKLSKLRAELAKLNDNTKTEDIADTKVEKDIGNQKKENLKDDLDAIKNIDKLSQENKELLEKYKKAKKSSENDEKIMKEMKKRIAEIEKERDALKEKYAGKLPEFGGNIAELPTKVVEFKFLGRTKEGGQTTLRIGPEIKVRHNIISRRRINTTVRKLNELGKDLGPNPEKNPNSEGVKKGVKYILNRSFLLHGGKVSSTFKNIKNVFKIKTTAEFDEEFGKQKKYILEDLKSKIEANTMSEQDKKTIEAVSKRLDYYQAAYKRIFITA